MTTILVTYHMILISAFSKSTFASLVNRVWKEFGQLKIILVLHDRLSPFNLSPTVNSINSRRIYH